MAKPDTPSLKNWHELHFLFLLIGQPNGGLWKVALWKTLHFMNQVEGPFKMTSSFHLALWDPMTIFWSFCVNFWADRFEEFTDRFVDFYNTWVCGGLKGLTWLVWTSRTVILYLWVKCRKAEYPLFKVYIYHQVNGDREFCWANGFPFKQTMFWEN